MAESVTFGQAMLSKILPPGFYKPGDVLDKDGIKAVMTRIATEMPDKYEDISHKLVKLGLRSGEALGGASFGLDDLVTPPEVTAAQDRVKSKVAMLLRTMPRGPERKARIAQVIEDSALEIPKIVMAAAEANGNQFAKQLKGAGRGNAKTLTSMMAGPLIAYNSSGDIIPIPLLRGYNQGQSFSQYLASSYGARRDINTTKLSVGSSGYLSKLLQQSAHRAVVTGRGDEDPNDTGDRGIYVDLDDVENVGATLGRNYGPYKRNTIVTPKVLAGLQKYAKDGKVLLRSPIASASADDGVYALDVGVREHGRLALRGEHVGLPAGQAIGEKVTQSSLCLSEGTLVRMGDGSVKAIEQIRVGDYVLGSDRSGMCSPVEVVEFYDQGVAECVEVTYRRTHTRSSGERLSLIATPQHKILATRLTSSQKSDVDNWTFSERQCGEKAKTIIAKMPQLIEYSIDSQQSQFKFAEIFGWLLGDGCYTEAVGEVMVSCNDPSLVSYMRFELRKHGFDLVWHKGSQCYWRLSDRNPINVKGRRHNRLKLLLKEYGMWGKYAHEKYIPEEWLKWPKYDLVNLLRGLFASDGTVCFDTVDGKPVVGFCSTSLKMLNQVRDILRLRFGIYGGKVNEDTREDRKRPLYDFTFSTVDQVLSFLDQVGIPGTRGKNLVTALNVWLDGRERKGQTGFIRKSIESVGVRRVFDIEVDSESHLFVLANGLIVSNSAKHGASGVKVKKTPGLDGFALSDRLVNPPQEGVGLAIHAGADGRIESIREAPQGGKFLKISGQEDEQYVPAEFSINFKVGDTVEAGDVLTDGIPDPAEVARHKGIGAARLAFVKSMHRGLKEAGFSVDRRNIEILAQGLYNRVEFDDEHDGILPGTVKSYGRVAANWKPREGHQVGRPAELVGSYLEKPVLYHSIGTRITPSVRSELESAGITAVTAHKDRLPFSPKVVRASDLLQTDDDYMTRFLGSSLEKSLLDSIHQSGESDEAGTSFVPVRAGAVGLKNSLFSGKDQ